MELAAVNDENPFGSRGLDAVCQTLALAGSKGKNWWRRESNPRSRPRNSLMYSRLWNILHDVGVSWEWKDDAHRQPLALGNHKLHVDDLFVAFLAFRAVLRGQVDILEAAPAAKARWSSFNRMVVCIIGVHAR